MSLQIIRRNHGKAFKRLADVRILLLAFALIWGTLFPCLAPALAESSARLAWNERAAELAANYEMPPDYDGSLWRTYHGATEEEYYDMLVRKSEDANWDLFVRSGVCQPMDDTMVGEGFYRYLSYEPFMDKLTCASQLYTNYDMQSWYIHPLSDSEQLLFLFLIQYYQNSPADSPLREQGFAEFARPFFSGSVRLRQCELYDWVTDGYDQGYVDCLIYTEADDYYLFECTPEDGGDPIQVLVHDYAYYDAWRPMNNREAIEGPVVETDINALMDITYGGILTSQLDVKVLNVESIKFKVDVRYENAEEEGSIDAIITVDFERGDEENPVDSIDNVQLTLEGLNGFMPHETQCDLGTLIGPVEVTVRYDYYDPEGLIHPSRSRPKVLFHLTGKNCKPYDYSCEMDVQPQARLFCIYLGGPGVGNADAIENAANNVQGAFAGRTYDGQPLIPVKMLIPKAGNPFMEDAYAVLQSFNTDENDITYIYIATHGERNGSKIKDNMCFPTLNTKTVDGKIVHVTVDYQSLLSTIKANLKGRVVILIDSCYSGKAIDTARSLSVDTKRYFVATGTTSYYSEYTPFVSPIEDTMILSYLVKKASKKYTNAECEAIRTLSHGKLEILEWYFTIRCWQLVSGLEFAAMSNEDKAVYIANQLFPDEITEKMEFLKELKYTLESKLREKFAYYPNPDTAIREVIDETMSFINGLIKGKNEDETEADQKKTWLDKSRNTDWLSDKMLDALAFAWEVNEPQFYGNEDLPLIFNDADFDDHYRLPVPLVEETAWNSYMEEAAAEE